LQRIVKVNGFVATWFCRDRLAPRKMLIAISEERTLERAGSRLAGGRGLTFASASG